MSVGWVAGSARARLLLGRCVGSERARQIAARPPDEAVVLLAGTVYGRHGDLGADLGAAQRSIAATLLLHLRLLAGWLPPGALGVMRALAAWFELANVEDRLAYLLGGDAEHPFDLGSLATAWSVLGAAQSPAELRAGLAASAWGDPESEEPHDVHLALRLAWARRLVVEVPETREWVGGALGLLLARERLLLQQEPRPGGAAVLGLGAGWERALSVAELAAALPRDAAWPLEGVAEPEDLWRAEAAWWARLERDAEAMVRGHREGRHAAVGAVVLLAVDAHRVQGALAAAARDGAAGLEEVLHDGA